MNIEGAGLSRNDLLLYIAKLAFLASLGIFSVKWAINQLDPTNNARKKARKQVMLNFSIIYWRLCCWALFFICQCFVIKHFLNINVVQHFDTG